MNENLDWLRKTYGRLGYQGLITFLAIILLGVAIIIPLPDNAGGQLATTSFALLCIASVSILISQSKRES